MSGDGDKKDEGNDRPLSETMQIQIVPSAIPIGADLGADPFDEDSVIVSTTPSRFDSVIGQADSGPHHKVALGESLQLVRFVRRGNTLMISGLTPHGRRLTFEQRDDREGWYVVVAGRRRRPTERELGLIVASITQEMEAAMAPEGEQEVRSAYRLAASSDQPGLPVRGLQAYRDLVLDEAAAYLAGQIQRLGVVAVEYQAFKRFAIRHGHRIGAAFVRALGERLAMLFEGEPKLHACHKAGKSFRLIVADRSAAAVQELVETIVTLETRQWIVERVWGQDQRTHPEEVNFYIGIAMARPSERKISDHETLAQRLNDDAYRAAKLGQLRGHTSIQLAKTDYRSTVAQWIRASEDELEEIAAQMDEGPAEVMAEMQDYLHELVPADLEGMAVEGDVHALIHKAIARDGFWQGTTAMRIAGERLITRFLENHPTPDGQNDYVGGFDLGDEFYGISIEKDRLHFAWSDLNSAGATRTRAGLSRIQHAVGWRREDGGGIVGHFMHALANTEAPEPLPERILAAARESYVETRATPELSVADVIDIADYLWTDENELVTLDDLYEGNLLRLVLPDRSMPVEILERRSSFFLKLRIDGVDHVASATDTFTGPVVKLRIRDAVISVATCVLAMKRLELHDVLAIVREDNNLSDDEPLDVLGFLRHIADILLADQVKGPGKIRLALGAQYEEVEFVKVYSLEDVREQHPGLFYEAVHQALLTEHPLDIDRNLSEMIVTTMLARSRPV